MANLKVVSYDNLKQYDELIKQKIDSKTTDVNIVSPLTATTGATTSDVTAVAVGDKSSATGYGAVAEGYNANASAVNAVALGTNSSAANASSVALGTASTVLSTDGNVVSVGNSTVNRKIIHVADPTADQDVATKKYVDAQVSGIEMPSVSDEINSLAPLKVDTAANANGSDSIAIGDNAVAGSVDGEYSMIAIGGSANTAYRQSLALGSDTSTKHLYNVAIGGSATTSGQSATAIGSLRQSGAMLTSTRAVGKNSIALGAGSKTTEDESNTLSVGDSSYTRRIIHVTDPENDQDAATKSYVDKSIQSIPTADASTSVAIFDCVSDDSGNITLSDGAAFTALTEAYNAGKACYLRVSNYPGLTLPAIMPLFVIYEGQMAMFSGAGTFDGKESSSFTLTWTVNDTVTAAVTIASSAPDWGDVVNKPFKSIEEDNGLEVIDNKLYLDGSSVINTVVPLKVENIPSVRLGTDIAIGSKAKALGVSSGSAIAIGDNSSSDGSGAISIGYYSSSPTGKAIAIGDSSKASGAYSIGIGWNAETVGWQTVSLGMNALAKGDSSIAIGDYASTTGVNSIAVGSSAEAGDERSVSIGIGAKALSKRSIALGGNSYTDQDYTVSVGSNTGSVEDFTRRVINVTDPVNAQDAATKNYVDNHSNTIYPLTVATTPTAETGSISIGNASVSANNAVALGEGSSATQQATALGYYARVTGQYGVAIGNVVSATQSGAVAIGTNAKAINSGSIAIGQASSTTRDDEFSIGYSSGERYLANVKTPENDTDAANKAYVDAAVPTADIIANTDARHTHDNKDILDSIKGIATASDLASNTNSGYLVPVSAAYSALNLFTKYGVHNPYALTVKNGATTTVYDGSEAATVEIPDVDFVDYEERATAEYTNQLPLSIDSTGAIFNDGLGYKSGVELTAKGGETSSSGCYVTGWIPCKKGDIIRIKDGSGSYYSGGYVALNTSASVSAQNIGKTYSAIMGNPSTYGTMTVSDGVITWDITNAAYYFWNDFAYARFTLKSADSIITVNEEIKSETETVPVLKTKFKVKKESLDFDLSAANGILSGKNIVVFGDSIIGMVRDSTSIPSVLAEYTGATVYNVGFGGCRMSVHPSTGYAAFSMWALADAVSSGDWSLQEAQAASGSDYFADQLAVLKGIDFSTIDIIVIHYGTNDFGSGCVLDNSSDTDSTSTLCGALRYSLDKLCAAYPKIKIFISLPIYRMWNGTGAETYTNSQSKTLPEYVEGLRSVAKEYHVPVLDGYDELGINKINDGIYSDDGTHLNEFGRGIMGRWLAGKLC